MIPVAKPFLGEAEAEAVREVILTGWVTQGPKVTEFENSFATYVGAKHACAVSSCTTALHLALIAVGVKPGDVVITVSHSFIATANAVRYCGAEPVFVDIDPNTYNMSPKALEKCLNEDCEIQAGQLFYNNISKIAVNESPLCHFMKTQNPKIKTQKFRIGRVAAIMPVHQMGMPCDLRAISSVASTFNLPVVEDAACAIGSEINIDGSWEKIGKPHGDIACFSFHPRKIITTGDGGMLTTNNPDFDKKFRLLRQHGMSIPDTIRHSTKKVVFEEYITTGFNYRMTDIQAAVGIEQMKKLPEILKIRRNIDKLYKERLNKIKWLQLQIEPDYARTNWQSYPVKILTDSTISRDELMQCLLDKGISTRPGIMNAHEEKAYYTSGLMLPQSKKARREVILLPIFADETIDVKKIVGALIGCHE